MCHTAWNEQKRTCQCTFHWAPAVSSHRDAPPLQFLHVFTSQPPPARPGHCCDVGHLWVIPSTKLPFGTRCTATVRENTKPSKYVPHFLLAKQWWEWLRLKFNCTPGKRTMLVHHERDFTWAVLKRSFILQGRKELLTPSLTRHLRGRSASLRMGIPVFCLSASLRRLTHLRDLLRRTFLWPPPFLPHEGGFIAWLTSKHEKGSDNITGLRYLMYWNSFW